MARRGRSQRPGQKQGRRERQRRRQRQRQRQRQRRPPQKQKQAAATGSTASAQEPAGRRRYESKDARLKGKSRRPLQGQLQVHNSRRDAGASARLSGGAEKDEKSECGISAVCEKGCG